MKNPEKYESRTYEYLHKFTFSHSDILSAWVPFIVFKVSCLNTKDESQYWLYQQLSLCAELALFLSKPLADGMLLKKNRLQIKVLITRATQSTLTSLYSITTAMADGTIS